MSLRKFIIERDIPKVGTFERDQLRGAAAKSNEVLSKLAGQLDRAWPGRVVSVAWGPWAEVGMVAELEKHLVARGLKLISPEQGSAFAADELAFGRKGTPEVVFAGGTETPVKAARTAAEPATAGTV